MEIKLPEVEVKIFDIFANWVYFRALDPSTYMRGSKPAFYILLKVYALADRLCVEQLRNEITDIVAHIAKEQNSILTPTDTFLLYDRIRDSAPIRQLILDLFTSMKTDRLLEDHPDTWHPQFLLELLIRVKRTKCLNCKPKGVHADPRHHRSEAPLKDLSRLRSKEAGVDTIDEQVCTFFPKMPSCAYATSSEKVNGGVVIHTPHCKTRRVHSVLAHGCLKYHEHSETNPCQTENP